MTSLTQRDEREQSIDLAADHLAFLVICYGALGLAAYKSLALGQGAWDLLALVIAGGLTGFVVRIAQGAAGPRWTVSVAVVMVLAAVIAAAAVALGWAR